MPTRPSIPDLDDEQLATGLGWFSLALGGLQLAAPRFVNFVTGIDNRLKSRALQRFVGVREIAAGAGILSQAQPYPFLAARVVGDVMDIAALALAMTSRRNGRIRVALSTALVGGITAVDVAATRRVAQDAGRLTEEGLLRVRASTTVNRPVADVYAFWRDFENLPQFMAHLHSVERMDESRWRWRARGPGATTFEWDAEIVDDVPDVLLSWGSVDGSGIENSGLVRFMPAPAGQGTEVTVELEYRPPAGPLGAAVATLLGEEPAQQVRDDLRRFKQVVETGEVVASEGTPEGTLARRQLMQRVAQPLG